MSEAVSSRLAERAKPRAAREGPLTSLRPATNVASHSMRTQLTRSFRYRASFQRGRQHRHFAIRAERSAARTSITRLFLSMTDRSIAQSSELKPKTNVRVIRFEKNTGQSAAIYAGLKAARGATAVLIDGDLQNDPADIPRLLAEIARGADLVCGYRAQRRDTRVKRLTSSDCQCGSQPFHKRRRARHRLHAQGDAARMRERARSIQGNAPFHSRASQRCRLPACGNSGQSSAASLRSEQIRVG